MGSKVFLFLCLSLAIVLLISSQVAANDASGVGDAKYGGGGYQGYPGRGGYGGNPGRGGYGGNPGRGGGGGRGGYGGGGGHCYYGCCRRSYNGRECLRCCNYAGQAVEAKPHN